MGDDSESEGAEGAEEEELDTSVLDKVNTRLANVPDTDCRMEDILMEW